jgi:hypothetical protein
VKGEKKRNQNVFAVNKIHALTRRIQLTGWGCGGTRKINRLFDLPLAAADAQTFGLSRIRNAFEEPVF